MDGTIKQKMNCRGRWPLKAWSIYHLDVWIDKGLVNVPLSFFVIELFPRLEWEIQVDECPGHFFTFILPD